MPKRKHHGISKDKVGGKSMEPRRKASEGKSKRQSEAAKDARIKKQEAADKKKKKKKKR